MDPKALFVLMFADFEHLVGDLATFTVLSAETLSESRTSGEDVDGEMAAELKKKKEARDERRQRFQMAREEHLVNLLNRRLEPWLSGDENRFIEHAKDEVLYLRGEPFGCDCLRTAGYIYQKKASKLVEKKGMFGGISNFFEDVGEKAHYLKSQVRAFEGGIKAASQSTTANDNEFVEEKQRREAVSTLGAVWLAAVVDIESTLSNVVSKALFLDDPVASKSAEVRRKAEGLIVLSKIFRQA